MTSKLVFRILFLLLITRSALAQHVSLPNPIMFVTQVPIPSDSSTVTTVFSNHLGSMMSAGRGGDLYIYYPDGTLKNLTKLAGFGTDSLQGADAIEVRQPSVHWSGKKAFFSMVIGAPTTQGQIQQYFWQIYEVTNLGETETPIITKIANQPPNYNNISPIYGTDERIIYTSDRPHGGQAHLYPLLDERFSFPATTGLWSLDPSTGDLFQMNVSPSGAFSPFIDSYGRVVFTRWDHLQRDENADKDAVTGSNMFGTFNYSDESANATITDSRLEVFPEPSPSRQDLLSGTNIRGLTFDQFFPWQINEDGTSEETLNHIGRHELLTNFTRSLTDDTNVTDFLISNSGRLNNPANLQSLLEMSEDPLNPGTYYGINVLQSGFDQHSSGQIVSLSSAPTLDPGAMALSYITHEATALPTIEGGTPNPNNSGHYRNPIRLSNGTLIAVHTAETRSDKRGGTHANPFSRYDFRIKTMKRSGNIWVADSFLTTGIRKRISYWDPNALVTFDTIFWELDPVEIRARTKPVRRTSILPSPEQQVLIEEGVDEKKLRDDMKQNNLGMLVSRDVTHRDKSDHQQPYFLKVHNSLTQSSDAHGKIYDIDHVQLFQADYLRGLKNKHPVPMLGRRILAQFMHDTAFSFNPHTVGEQSYSVKIAPDGSFAAFVPTQRAIAWALADSNFNPVVRERYWITTQPGEIRVCASCHGTNDDALVHADPAPQNKPEALRSLLKYWKSSHTPLSPELISPPNDSSNISIMPTLIWSKVGGAKTYQITIASTQDFGQVLFTSTQQSDTSFVYSSNQNNTTFFWRVQAFDDAGAAAYSGIWKFTTEGKSDVPREVNKSVVALSNHPNPFSSNTSIDFILPQSGMINLRVLNVLGQEVGALANGFFESGKHSLQWDASKMPIGIYYYRLQTDQGAVTGTMNIVR